VGRTHTYKGISPLGEQGVEVLFGVDIPVALVPRRSTTKRGELSNRRAKANRCCLHPASEDALARSW